MIMELLVAIAISTATNVQPLSFQDSAAINSILTPPPGSWSAQFEEVVFLIKTKYNTSDQARSWALYIMRYTKDVKIDPKLFAALIRTESYGNPNAISIAGAIGLAQVIPRYWHQIYPECGRTSTIFYLNQGFANPKINICYGSKILDFYIHKASIWFMLDLGFGFTIPVFLTDMHYALNLYSGFNTQYVNSSSPYSSRIARLFEGEI